MKTTQIINQLLKIEDDYIKLEQENTLLKMALNNSDKPKASIILEKLVSMGKEKLFRDVYIDYRSSLSYDESGADKTFEEWLDSSFYAQKCPENLSLVELKEVVWEKFEEEYARLLKLAQLEYARSQIGK